MKFFAILLTLVAFLTGMVVGAWWTTHRHKGEVVAEPTSNFKTAGRIFGPYPGTVDYVRDGDTIYIKLDLGFDLTVYTRVRVYGINAPELNTDAGKAARQFAMGLLPVGDNVWVTSHGWDKYGGRIDGEIQMANGGDFAAAMLAAGQAVVYTT